MLVRLPLDATPSPLSSAAPQVDPERVTPGLLGLLFFVLLAVAVYFLWRSMNRQLGRVDFDEASTAVDPSSGGSSGSGTSGGASAGRPSGTTSSPE